MKIKYRIMILAGRYLRAYREEKKSRGMHGDRAGDVKHFNRIYHHLVCIYK
jgi:hypothetical protein